MQLVSVLSLLSRNNGYNENEKKKKLLGKIKEVLTEFTPAGAAISSQQPPLLSSPTALT